MVVSINPLAVVTKVQSESVPSGLPARSSTAPSTCMAYCVPGVRSLSGLSVAVTPEYVSVNGTGVFGPSMMSAKLAGMMVVGSIGSLNVTVMSVVSSTSVSFGAGSRPTMVGGVTSAPSE